MVKTVCLVTASQASVSAHHPTGILSEYDKLEWSLERLNIPYIKIHGILKEKRYILYNLYNLSKADSDTLAARYGQLSFTFLDNPELREEAFEWEIDVDPVWLERCCDDTLTAKARANARAHYYKAGHLYS